MSPHSLLGLQRTRLKHWLKGPQAYSILEPKNYERLQFKLMLGYWPNFENPVTFSEKVAWRKFYEDMSGATTLADKSRSATTCAQQ